MAVALLLARAQVLSGDLDAALGALAATSLLLLGGWVGLSALALALLQLPGRLGELGRGLLRLLLPRALRLAVLGLIGAHALTGAAWADPGGADVPTVERPLTTAVPALAPLPAPRSAQRSVVVQPGDSLWTIAADHLGRGAGATQVAQAWPRWYAANATVIGRDPDLLAVGTVLVVPGGAP
jgi:nucleoid-associated protein YgaU